MAAEAPVVDSIRLTTAAGVLVTAADAEFVNRVTSAEIMPQFIVLDPTDSVQLRANAYDRSGQQISGVEFKWGMTDPRAGNITETGMLTASFEPGVYAEAVTLTVVQNTPSGIEFIHESAPVTIVGEPLDSRLSSIAVLPDNPTVLAGQIYRMRAVGFDETGLTIPGVSFSWRVLDADLGHINDLGYLTVEAAEGHFPASVAVSGIWEGETISRTIDVTVVEVPDDNDFLRVEILPKNFHVDFGGRIELRAFAFNGIGEIVSGAQFRWNVTDPRAGTISSTGVFFPGESAGIFTESVQVEAVVAGASGISRASDFASVIVKQPQGVPKLEALQVIPQTVKIPSAGRSLLIAQASDEFGRPAENVTISWEALQENAGTIDNSGRFLASTIPGRYTSALRVTARQQVGDETVTRSRDVDVIITGALAEVEIRPSLATIAPGRTVHFTTIARDRNGEVLNEVVTLWRVSDARVGVIDPFGNFTAGQVPGLFEGAVQAEVVQRTAR
jgi:hypothetical protein